MTDTVTRTWTINGVPRTVTFTPLARLLDVLRDDLDLISLKEGCGEGECGACSVLINGELRLACLMAAAQVDDAASITTAEGLADEPTAARLRQSFDAAGAVQCGYCTPGMLVGGTALLRANPAPSEEEIRRALAGHLCRCTGYSRIITAVQQAAQKERP